MPHDDSHSLRLSTTSLGLHDAMSVLQRDPPSPPTSPPSSAAPLSDDEFTTNLIRRAARNLGVQYAPAPSRGTRGAAELSHVPKAAVSAAAAAPVPGPQSWVAFADCSLHEIERMIDVRTAALGPHHLTVAGLYGVLGDKYAAAGETAHAERYYRESIARLEQVHDDGDVTGDAASRLAVSWGSLGIMFAQANRNDLASQAFMAAGTYTSGPPPAPERSAALTALEQDAESSDKVRRLLAGCLLPAGKGTSPQALASALIGTVPMPRAAMVDSSDQTDLPAPARGPPRRASMPLDPPTCLSEAQQSRLQAPGLRTASDLTALVHGRGLTPVAKHAAATISAARARLGLADVSHGPAVAASLPGDERAVRLDNLRDTIRRVKAHEPQVPDPLTATERQVAHLLLEASQAT